MQELLPVTLLTGFLGSGKTTLLNSLLRQRPLTAVVMNEFGEVAIDHQLLQETRGPLALLAGGCVCCQVQGALAPTLKNLYLGRRDGKLPPYERIIIETTGVADPAPVLGTLLADRWIAARHKLDGVITTVDAVFANGQLDSHFEAVRQIALADRLILTKTDLAAPDDIAALHVRLQALNPAAPILEAVDGVVDPARLTELALFDRTGQPRDVQRWLADRRYRSVTRPDPAGTAAAARAIPRAPTHDARIRAFSISFSTPLDWLAVSSALELLRAHKAQNLLRMKAIVNIEGKTQPLVLHGVQHILYPPAELPAWPDADRLSRFVFITADLEAEFVAGLLADFTQAVDPHPTA